MSHPSSRVSTRASVVSRSSSHLSISMANLRERQKLERQRTEIAMEKRFLQEQQKLLEAAIATEEEKRSRVSHDTSMRRVHEWIGDIADLQISAVIQTPAALAFQRHDPHSTQISFGAEAVGGLTEGLPSSLDTQQHSSPLQGRSIPTSKRRVDHQEQWNQCKKELEGMHSTMHRLSIMPSTVTPGRTLLAGSRNDVPVQLSVGTQGTVAKQTNVVSRGKCHAFENHINRENKSDASQPILPPTTQFPQNEQQRLAHVHSSLINNKIILLKQTRSPCTFIPPVTTAKQPTVQQPPVQLPSVQQSTVQHPTMQ
ncbi:uncharacterized protein LOC129724171 [Wyeomyia smithii]|uniref:uncharacterized protein LOC129724171 n=1 Tax=Wyeomyia smithii TaxID=174621 RepID=UPI002467C519|nr:uncharacterized protein LOC129724171 [Wyeomyia smithii]